MNWFPAAAEVVDLSRPVTNGLQAHVTTSILPLRQIGDAPGRFDPPCEGFSANLLVMSDHCGTHVDAPSHFIRDGSAVDRIELSRLIGRAAVLDLSSCAGPMIEEDDLEAAHEAAGAEILLLHCRPRGGAGRGLTKGAAEYLVATGAKAIGTDHSGIDDTGNRDRPGHMVLLGAGLPIVESLTGLDRLLGRRFLFIALPLRIEGGTGSPVRAVAVVQPPSIAQ